MKNALLFLSSVLITLNVFAQAPQKMSYQAVIRDATNALISGSAVGMRISILQGSASGPAVYVETQTPITNLNGLASIEIGAGTVVSGSFPAIIWGSGQYFVKTETDPMGGISYSITGTTQMLSVPYALYAEKSGSATASSGKTYLILSGNITDLQAAAKITAEAGPNTQFVWIQNTTALTTVDLSGLTDLIDLRISNNAALTTVNVMNVTKLTDGLNVSGNPVLTSISMPFLAEIGGAFKINTNGLLTLLDLPLLQNISSENTNNISGNAVLTNLAFPSVATLGVMTINSNIALSSISFPQLTAVLNWLAFNDNGLLASLPFPVLSAASSLQISGNAVLTSLVFPALTTITGNSFASWNPVLTSLLFPVLVNATAFDISNNSLLNTLSFAVLSSCGQLGIRNTLATTLSFPALTTSTALITIQDNSQLTSVSLPVATTAKNVYSINNPLLSVFSIPALSTLTGALRVQQSALPSSEVNLLLTKMLTVSPSSGVSIYLDLQTPPAPPTGAGITAKATLIANGQTVITD